MPVVISLISSSDSGSPPRQRVRPPSPRQTTSTAAKTGGVGFTEKSSINSRPAIPSVADDVWTFSDEDDIVAPANVRPSGKSPNRPSINVPSPKRPRLDSYNWNDISSSLRLPGGPSPTKPSSAKANAPIVIDDVDDFTSSPPARLPVRPAASWDPISSSAPLPVVPNDEPSNPPRSIRRTQSAVIALDDSDPGDSDDEFPDIADLTSKRHQLAALSRPSPNPTASQPARRPAADRRKPSSAAPKKTAEERKREREAKAAAREAEKERAKQEKARAAALAEVNKLRTDKKVSTPEMIVDLPDTLSEGVRLQTETLLRDLEVTSTTWSSPVEDVVRWRRKVRARYNDDLGHWEPIPETIEHENYAMVVMTAARFVELVVADAQQTNLESHALRMKRHFPGDTIMYLIEGLDAWLRKNRSLRNRKFVSAVRSGLEQQQQHPDDPGPSSSQARRRRQNTTPTYVDEEVIDQSLLQLQVLHSFLIHHTVAPVDTARWLTIFTQHISTAPYRRQRDAATDAAGVAFCMESGQVRTGDSPRDTYVRVLQEIGRVTAPVAYGVVGEYPTLQGLVRVLETRGPLALEGVRRGVNKEGDVGERMVGPAVSKRMWKIFLGRDEGSTDI
ncbi:hypothetical protein VTJ49DRAFT_3488 [Mycothermus thermophilus]|uniref:ERCC4 domain-containing protein n=1 Tax=Humicola insolens TaxID=85995 RepID=A0ABR3V7E7_HUMIN